MSIFDDKNTVMKTQPVIDSPTDYTPASIKFGDVVAGAYGALSVAPRVSEIPGLRHAKVKLANNFFMGHIDKFDSQYNKAVSELAKGRTVAQEVADKPGIYGRFLEGKQKFAGKLLTEKGEGRGIGRLMKATTKNIAPRIEAKAAEQLTKHLVTRGAEFGVKTGLKLGMRAAVAGVHGIPVIGWAVGAVLDVGMWFIDPEWRGMVKSFGQNILHKFGLTTSKTPGFEDKPTDGCNFLPICHDGNRDDAIRQADAIMTDIMNEAYRITPDLIDKNSLWKPSEDNLQFSDTEELALTANNLIAHTSSFLNTVNKIYTSSDENLVKKSAFSLASPTKTLDELQGYIVPNIVKSFQSLIIEHGNLWQAVRNANIHNREAIVNSTNGINPFSTTLNISALDTLGGALNKHKTYIQNTESSLDKLLGEFSENAPKIKKTDTPKTGPKNVPDKNTTTPTPGPTGTLPTSPGPGIKPGKLGDKPEKPDDTKDKELQDLLDSLGKTTTTKPVTPVVQTTPTPPYTPNLNTPQNNPGQLNNPFIPGPGLNNPLNQTTKPADDLLKDVNKDKKKQEEELKKLKEKDEEIKKLKEDAKKGNKDAGKVKPNLASPVGAKKDGEKTKQTEKGKESVKPTGAANTGAGKNAHTSSHDDKDDKGEKATPASEHDSANKKNRTLKVGAKQIHIPSETMERAVDQIQDPNNKGSVTFRDVLRNSGYHVPGPEHDISSTKVSVAEIRPFDVVVGDNNHGGLYVGDGKLLMDDGTIKPLSSMEINGAHQGIFRLDAPTGDGSNFEGTQVAAAESNVPNGTPTAPDAAQGVSAPQGGGGAGGTSNIMSGAPTWKRDNAAHANDPKVVEPSTAKLSESGIPLGD